RPSILSQCPMGHRSHQRLLRPTGTAHITRDRKRPGSNGRSSGPSIRRRMKGPLTHLWEYGQWLDPYTQGEHIRNHLLRAIYGTLSNFKTMDPENYANIEL